MLAPMRWIKDYADVKTDAKTLADQMVMTGNGVEGIETPGADIQNVVAGRITKIEKHPDADKLRVCMVDVGTETLQIVTGADNVFEGMDVPVAKAPATLPGGPIKKGKLRGVESNGMLCSGAELNLKEEDYPGAGVDGIMRLWDEPNPGTDVVDFLELSGEVIEFEVGANRPDCLSVLGIAREAAAAQQVKFHAPAAEYDEKADAKTEDIVNVEVRDTDLCTRYIAAAVTDVAIGPSPMWIRTRLREAGIRPINNIVDITNFVMVETGQPMHAFDAADIRGKKITVRRAKAGEKMKTLDGKEREFNENMLLICDAEGPVGIAGVMGGADSEIKATTATIVFEAAAFGYGNVRQTARALGISTESSLRFSKGVDAAGTPYAMRRALTLVEETGAGKVCKGMTDILNEDLSMRVVKTHSARVNALLGTDLKAKEMRELLNRAFIETGSIGDELICTIPSWRGDIAGGADIAEEVARMYGYDNIPATAAAVGMKRGGVSAAEQKTDAAKDYLAANGWFECMTYSFTGAAEYEKLGMALPESVRIVNPLGDESAYMRTTLAAHMLEAAAMNLNRQNKKLRLFEAARAYLPEGGVLPREEMRLCLAASGAGEDFYTLKGAVENIVRLCRGAEISCARAGVPYLHPGASAEVFVGGTSIGTMGEVAPDAAKAFSLDQKVWLAELNLDALFAMGKPKTTFRALPKYPAATRDIAVTVDREAGAGSMMEAVRAAGGKRLERVELFDVYEGGQVPEGKKSVAYALTLRAEDGTLTDAEVEKIMAKVMKALEDGFGAKLRA